MYLHLESNFAERQNIDATHLETTKELDLLLLLLGLSHGSVSLRPQLLSGVSFDLDVGYTVVSINQITLLTMASYKSPPRAPSWAWA